MNRVILLLIFLSSCFLRCHSQSTAVDKVKNHKTDEYETCVGRCSYELADNFNAKFGPDGASQFLNLEFDRLLELMSNQTFFNSFCSVYNQSTVCFAGCPVSYFRELVLKGSEVVNLLCVDYQKDILDNFPCIAGLDNEKGMQCLKLCTPHHDNIVSLSRNLHQLLSSGNPAEAEQLMAETCELVICSLHCDAPAIAHKCGHGTATLLVTLMQKMFAKLRTIALGTGAVAKWPAGCNDIDTYALPNASDLITDVDETNQTNQKDQRNQKGQTDQTDQTATQSDREQIRLNLNPLTPVVAAPAKESRSAQPNSASVPSCVSIAWILNPVLLFCILRLMYLG